ncbi:MAG: hypothetical protein M3362_06865 [Acidobacteriota bacterium]|nr:hypothetical protein [Acidobacteriota bacterium]
MIKIIQSRLGLNELLDCGPSLAHHPTPVTRAITFNPHQPRHRLAPQSGRIPPWTLESDRRATGLVQT